MRGRPQRITGVILAPFTAGLGLRQMVVSDDVQVVGQDQHILLLRPAHRKSVHDAVLVPEIQRLGRWRTQNARYLDRQS